VGVKNIIFTKKWSECVIRRERDFCGGETLIDKQRKIAEILGNLKEKKNKGAKKKGKNCCKKGKKIFLGEVTSSSTVKKKLRS